LSFIPSTIIYINHFGGPHFPGELDAGIVPADEPVGGGDCFRAASRFTLASLKFGLIARTLS
jgi:hypothetical protein